ncbi:MAG: hypothetical protein A3J65_03780 [Candidatus Buchananbacteria bacterium RIFCSPHIGHO2_02_FULL_45_11b]|uniref:Uncharacterized protein n=1 Tax=Candidatus Buchananbacteria bacterium RIFCSPHIGHO2_02_FULL_45_11b TaxID=1797541 RepID=A0A1G1YG82_9BACT|nr:MAG: hypothetical protein A3J65_03780 [Candidatus Buchananbacteria bacterium RIFCSPHIGHO2_02_FULL_45_11b]
MWGEFRRTRAEVRQRSDKLRPAALLVKSRVPQKSFLFLLPARIATQSVAGGEEKIRRAHIGKSEENFFVGWRVSARGGGAAPLVPFKVGSRKVYNYSTFNFFILIFSHFGAEQVTLKSWVRPPRTNSILSFYNLRGASRRLIRAQKSWLINKDTRGIGAGTPALATKNLI